MRGRPKLPDGEALSEILTLRLLPEELEFLQSAALKHGISVSDEARRRISRSYRIDDEVARFCKRLGERVNTLEAELRAKREE